MDYRQAVDWLFGVIQFGMKLGLDNPRALLNHFGVPHDDLKIIHVAGTNGKGSTCAFAHSCLSKAGIRTGLFTSPHLIDFRERIRVGEELIPEKDVAHFLTQIREHAGSMEVHPTFFEILFALALLHFREAGAEAAVIETGLGGRFDATNTITPAVSAITSIGLDHQKWLGETLAEIAGEKAGIIKQGIPAVSAPQQPEAQAVLEKRAIEVGTNLEIVTPNTYPTPDALGLYGGHQQENAALAVAAIKAAEFGLEEEDFTKGLKSTTWPARFQTIESHGGKIVIDGAHNAHAAHALKNTWRQVFADQKATVVYSAADGKDAMQFLEEIGPVAERFVFTSSSSNRAVTPGDLADLYKTSFTSADQPPFIIAEDPPSSLTESLNFSNPVLITGSLFLAGDVLALLEGEQQTDPSEKL